MSRCPLWSGLGGGLQVNIGEREMRRGVRFALPEISLGLQSLQMLIGVRACACVPRPLHARAHERDVGCQKLERPSLGLIPLLDGPPLPLILHPPSLCISVIDVRLRRQGDYWRNDDRRRAAGGSNSTAKWRVWPILAWPSLSPSVSHMVRITRERRT